MSTIYGPVLSWRFGRSLGIDVIVPPKKCTFNCIYCQLGRTKKHITGFEDLDEPLVGVARVLSDLEDTWKRIDLNTVDLITFSGMGEPTLNPNLGKIANEVRNRIRDFPLAILTNSSLLHRNDIRKNLCQFDLVVTKLDAGDNKTFQLINRPADNRLNVETIVDSIKKLRKEFEGVLALEVMLLSTEDRQVTNVEGRPLSRLLDAILDVAPDLVQLEVPYRPSSESFVRLPSQERIKSISQRLAEVLGEDKLQRYGLHDKQGKHVTRLTNESLENEVLDLLKRRPCRLIDVSASLGVDLSIVRSILRKLEEKGFIVVEESNKESYYFYCS